jgi:hypothetical protein
VRLGELQCVFAEVVGVIVRMIDTNPYAPLSSCGPSTSSAHDSSTSMIVMLRRGIRRACLLAVAGGGLLWLCFWSIAAWSRYTELARGAPRLPTDGCVIIGWLIVTLGLLGVYCLAVALCGITIIAAVTAGSRVLARTRQFSTPTMKRNMRDRAKRNRPIHTGRGPLR